MSDTVTSLPGGLHPDDATKHAIEIIESARDSDGDISLILLVRAIAAAIREAGANNGDTMPDPVAKPTPSGEEQIATVRRLVSQMEGRKLYLEAEHQAASIHVYKTDFDGLRSVLTRLESDASAALLDPSEELQEDLSEAFDAAFLPAWRECTAKHGRPNVIPAWASWGPKFLRAAAVARDHRISTAIAPAALLNPSEEVVEAAAWAFAETYFCGDGGPAKDAFPCPTCRHSDGCITAARAALRAAAMKITGQ